MAVAIILYFARFSRPEPLIHPSCEKGGAHKYNVTITLVIEREWHSNIGRAFYILKTATCVRIVGFFLVKIKTL